MPGGSMFKIIFTFTAALLVASSLALMPAAPLQVSPGTPMGAPSAALKADRIDLGARGGACAEQAWPYYDSACLYDALRPAGEVRKVRTVSADRLAITE
jgi:hypothetical protein